MIKDLLIKNQGFIFSVMIFILISFVVILLIWLKKIAGGRDPLSIKGGQFVIGKQLKDDIHKLSELIKENKNAKQQVEDLAKNLRNEEEKRKKDKANIDKEQAEEKKKLKESLNVLIKKIASVETSQKSIDSSIEALQNRIEDMREDMNSMDSSSGSVNVDGSSNKELKHEIDSLEEEIKANQKQMENWYRLFESIDADMVDINNKLKELEERKS